MRRTCPTCGKPMRAKPRKPDPVKLAANRAERRKAKGLDWHEPVGDEWE
jgi:hypothetical protein